MTLTKEELEVALAASEAFTHQLGWFSSDGLP